MILSLTLIVFANAVVFLVQDYIMELPPVFWQVWRPSRYAIPFVVMSLSLSAFTVMRQTGTSRNGHASFLLPFWWRRPSFS